MKTTTKPIDILKAIRKINRKHKKIRKSFNTKMNEAIQILK